MTSQYWSQMFDFLAGQSQNITNGVLANVIIRIPAIQIVVVNVGSAPAINKRFFCALNSPLKTHTAQWKCGNSRNGDEQKEVWRVELLNFLVCFFSDCSRVGHVKFQMDFYPPPFCFESVNQHQEHLTFLKKNDMR